MGGWQGSQRERKFPSTFKSGKNGLAVVVRLNNGKNFLGKGRDNMPFFLVFDAVPQPPKHSVFLLTDVSKMILLVLIQNNIFAIKRKGFYLSL